MLQSCKVVHIAVGIHDDSNVALLLSFASYAQLDLSCYFLGFAKMFQIPLLLQCKVCAFRMKFHFRKAIYYSLLLSYLETLRIWLLSLKLKLWSSQGYKTLLRSAGIRRFIGSFPVNQLNFLTFEHTAVTLIEPSYYEVHRAGQDKEEIKV